MSCMPENKAVLKKWSEISKIILRGSHWPNKGQSKHENNLGQEMNYKPYF